MTNNGRSNRGYVRKRFRKGHGGESKYREQHQQQQKPPRRGQQSSSLDKTYMKSYNSYDSASSSSTTATTITAEEQQYLLERHFRHSGGRGRRKSAREDMISIEEDFSTDKDDPDSESEASVYYEIVDDDDDNYDDNEDYDDEDYDNDGHNDCEVEIADPLLLPSPTELSNELCRIVLGSQKNCRRSALLSLLRLSGWVETKDPTFLKHFLTYGGAVKVLDFLQKVLSEEKEHRLEESTGKSKSKSKAFGYRIAVECIRLAGTIISGVCCIHEAQNESNTSGNTSCNASSNTNCNASINNVNQQLKHVAVSPRFLASVTATIVADHGGIKTMLQASDLCCRCHIKNDSTYESEASLESSEKVWSAIANTCSGVSDDTTAKMIENHFVLLWDAGFEAMEAFFLDPPSSSSCPKTTASTFLMRASVFRVFTRILVRFRDDFVKESEAFEEDILSRLLDILSGKNRKGMDDDASLNTFATGISSISMSFYSRETNCGTKEEEAFIEGALLFFFECQTQKLLFRNKKAATTTSSTSLPTSSSESSQSCHNNTTSDEKWCRFCEALLPLCVTGLKKYAVDNKTIRKSSIQILDASLCSINKNDQQQNLLTGLTEGALEAMAPCLSSETLDATEKDEIKEVVRKIAVVIYSVYIGEFGPSGYRQDL